MYNRYIPNPDGTYQRKQVFDSEPVEAKLERCEDADKPVGRPQTQACAASCKPQSRGKLDLSIDDLLVLGILLLILLEDDDDLLIVVLAIAAFLLL